MMKPRDRVWSPYVAGIILGVLVVLALVAGGAAPDPSAGFRAVAGAPDGVHGWWQVALLGGIVLGAFWSATLSKSRRQGQSRVWAAVLGTAEPRRRAEIAFAGGFLLLLGTGLAGGCLIGHGLAGVAQLALGSVVAFAAMALGGVVAGELMRRP